MENTLKGGTEFYAEHKDEMISLYTETFYQNKSSESLHQAIGTYFDRIFERGFGIFSINNSILNGMMLITPPEFDKNLPPEISKEIDTEKTLYIAEVLVSTASRGKGYGSKLMDCFFETLDEQYQTSIIRVVSTNNTAINLYEKFAFKKRCIILENKTDHNMNKMTLEKLYLVRNNNEENK